MENFTEGSKEILQDFNADKTVELIPAICYVAILMILGLVGNTMVCVFYGHSSRLTSTSFLILVVAVFDLLTCALLMPGEIADLSLAYLYNNNLCCKLQAFANYVSSLSAVFALALIALNRYKIMCKGSCESYKLRETKIMCLVTTTVAVFLSWPAFLFYGITEASIRISTNSTLVGYRCSQLDEEEYGPFKWLFDIGHIVVFVGVLVTLAVTYSLIGKTVLKHRRNQRERTMRQGPPGVDSNVTLTEVIRNLQLEQSSSCGPLAEATDSRRLKHTDGSLSAAKYTLMMFVITVIFVVSFLPYLAVSVWRSLSDRDVSSELTVGIVIAERSFLLNSALNPLVYGVMNSHLRRFFFRCETAPPRKRAFMMNTDLVQQQIQH